MSDDSDDDYRIGSRAARRSEAGRRKAWSIEEDEELLVAVQTVTGRSSDSWQAHESPTPEEWDLITLRVPGRNKKQCRERWGNKLNPGINEAPWTTDEVVKIFRLHEQLGNKWQLISEKMPGRTALQCRNCYNAQVHNLSKRGGMLSQLQSSLVSTPAGTPARSASGAVASPVSAAMESLAFRLAGGKRSAHGSPRSTVVSAAASPSHSAARSARPSPVPSIALSLVAASAAASEDEAATERGRRGALRGLVTSKRSRRAPPSPPGAASGAALSPGSGAVYRTQSRRVVKRPSRFEGAEGYEDALGEALVDDGPFRRSEAEAPRGPGREGAPNDESELEEAAAAAAAAATLIGGLGSDIAMQTAEGEGEARQWREWHEDADGARERKPSPSPSPRPSPSPSLSPSPSPSPLPSPSPTRAASSDALRAMKQDTSASLPPQRIVAEPFPDADATETTKAAAAEAVEQSAEPVDAAMMDHGRSAIDNSADIVQTGGTGSSSGGIGGGGDTATMLPRTRRRSTLLLSPPPPSAALPSPPICDIVSPTGTFARGLTAAEALAALAASGEQLSYPLSGQSRRERDRSMQPPAAAAPAYTQGRAPPPREPNAAVTATGKSGGGRRERDSYTTPFDRGRKEVRVRADSGVSEDTAPERRSDENKWVSTHLSGLPSSIGHTDQATADVEDTVGSSSKGGEKPQRIMGVGQRAGRPPGSRDGGRTFLSPPPFALNSADATRLPYGGPEGDVETGEATVPPTPVDRSGPQGGVVGVGSNSLLLPEFPFITAGLVPGLETARSSQTGSSSSRDGISIPGVVSRPFPLASASNLAESHLLPTSSATGILASLAPPLGGSHADALAATRNGPSPDTSVTSSSTSLGSHSLSSLGGPDIRVRAQRGPLSVYSDTGSTGSYLMNAFLQQHQQQRTMTGSTETVSNGASEGEASRSAGTSPFPPILPDALDGQGNPLFYPASSQVVTGSGQRQSGAFVSNAYDTRGALLPPWGISPYLGAAISGRGRAVPSGLGAVHLRPFQPMPMPMSAYEYQQQTQRPVRMPPLDLTQLSASPFQTAAAQRPPDGVSSASILGDETENTELGNRDRSFSGKPAGCTVANAVQNHRDPVLLAAADNVPGIDHPPERCKNTRPLGGSALATPEISPRTATAVSEQHPKLVSMDVIADQPFTASM